MHPWLDIRIPVGSVRIDDDQRPEMKKRLGEAIRACRLGHATQDEIAERTGIGQSTLSAYEQGKSVPNVLQLYAIEAACNRVAGWIVVRAGLVAEVKTIPEAIAVAPELSDGARKALLSLYEGVLEGVTRTAAAIDDA